MYNRRTSFVFRKGNIDTIFQGEYVSIRSAIESENEDFVLNVNESEYFEHLESNHRLNPPIIHFDQVYADSYEANIPAEYFPITYHVYQGKTYKQEVIQFFIPCSGDINLLNYSPSSTIFLGNSGHFEIQNQTIVTEFIKFSQSAEEIKRLYQIEVEVIHRLYPILIKDIENFNQTLRGQISSYFSQRKGKLLTKNNLLSSLGVPLRKKENIAPTFAVPKPQLREKVVVKPVVNEKGFSPEPTLDDKNYHTILKLINDVGKNFERMPSVYKEKSEEDLRDHILMILDPNFELGSATGETFNKTGKTDIQLRYDSTIIFIAECKFWSGEKNYLTTIDQLLKYLTWRDTKASIIIFVKQRDFTAILDKVESITKEHPNYIRFNNRPDENWFNFSFHIIDDRNREVKLAVQLYHLPPSK